jgi:hypothetical protein
MSVSGFRSRDYTTKPGATEASASNIAERGDVATSIEEQHAMGKVCKAGIADGMHVYTGEDRRFCEEGGGHVIEDGGGGCAAASVAAMSSRRGLQSAATLDVSPLRRLRKRMGGHGIVKDLLELSRLAANEVERLAFGDAEFLLELSAALADFSAVADAVTSEPPGVATYSAELHERLTRIARRVQEGATEPALREALTRVMTGAERFVNQSAADIAIVLGPPPADPSPADDATGPFQAGYPSAAVIAAAQAPMFAVALADVREYLRTYSLSDMLDYRRADRAIEAKARALGALPGAARGDTVAVPGGYMRSYEGCDIYVSKQGTAHEVHGAIREKYNALGGAAGILGLPVSDETGTPDGIGRYNHFAANGSIYWTPSTGPMAVRGAIRNLWASQGWERGPMGYPVADEYRLPPLLYPRDNPDIAWSLFQNGALFSKANAAATALAADISRDALKGLIRTFFDRGLKAASSDLGLEAQVDLLGVSGWGYGFWRSLPRTISYRLHGFHDNGLLPDTTFEIDVRLRFALAAAMSFTYPAFMTLIATLDGLSVTAHGLGSGTASKRIHDGVRAAFFRGGPDPAHPEVPDGAVFIAAFPTGVNQTGSGNIDVIDVLTTAQGGLQVLVNPLPPSFGGFRRVFAQNQIDAFLQNF